MRQNLKRSIAALLLAMGSQAGNQLEGQASPDWSLRFPLPVGTPYSATINSVFDHSMVQQYRDNGRVTAFTGELGDVNKDQCKAVPINKNLTLYQYKNRAGVPFLVNGGYNDACLAYVGHPGYDYRTRDISPGTGLRPGSYQFARISITVPESGAPTCNGPKGACPGRVAVWAAASGRVECVAGGCSEFPGSGGVIVDHLNGYKTIYLHMEQPTTGPFVSPNQSVQAGDVIGLSSNIGTKDPHLHFEVRYQGQQVDPYGWQGQYPDPRGESRRSTNLWKPRARAAAHIRWHPDGTIITADGQTFWLIEGGRKRGIPTADVFYAYGFDFRNAILVDTQELGCFPQGLNLQKPPSTRVLLADGGTVYEITDQNYRRAFPSKRHYLGQGFLWSEIPSFPSSLAGYTDDPNLPVYHSPFRDGTLVQSRANPGGTVYIISNSRKLGFSDQSTFIASGHRFEDVVPVDHSSLDAIPAAGAITESVISACAVGGSPTSPTFSISPSSGPQGTMFSFWGDGYTPNRVVQRFLQYPSGSQVELASVTANNAGQISWSYPSSCSDAVGTYSLWAVDVGSGRTSPTVTETITASSSCTTPVISLISPTTVVASDFDITIDGRNFDGGAIDQVYYGSTFIGNGQILSRSSTRIVVRQFMSRATPGTYTVKVRNSDGQLSNGAAFTLTAPPLTLSITPSSGPQGTTFSFSGSGYTAGGTVRRFLRYPNGAQVELASTAANASGQIGWSYPSSCNDAPGSYVLWALDAASSRTSPSVTETITSASQCSGPQISSLSPNQVPADQPWTITANGTNFQFGFSASVTTGAGTFRLSAGALTFVSSTQVRVQVVMNGPPPYSATLTIANPDGRSASSAFHVIALQPSISSISPSSVRLNQPSTLTVYGNNFHRGFSAAVITSTGTWPLTSAALTFVSHTQVRVQVTMGGSSSYPATLRITNAGGLSATGTFQVIP